MATYGALGIKLPTSGENCLSGTPSYFGLLWVSSPTPPPSPGVSDLRTRVQLGGPKQGSGNRVTSHWSSGLQKGGGNNTTSSVPKSSNTQVHRSAGTPNPGWALGLQSWLREDATPGKETQELCRVPEPNFTTNYPFKK